MALGESVESHLEEAEGSLRAALSFAARAERPEVCAGISELLVRLTTLKKLDNFTDEMEKQMKKLSDEDGGIGPFKLFG